MARMNPPPLVDHTHLLQLDRTAEAIPVGSPAWYTWLGNATSFVFRSRRGTFTAYKERRGPTQEYWKAYRRRAGRLQRVYLGKSGELTLDRLNAAAAELGNELSADAPTSGAAVLQTFPAPADVAEGVVKAGSDHCGQDGSFGLAERNSLYTTPAIAAPDDAQSLHLLSTKLAIPRLRAALVPRPRLTAPINTAIAQQQKLILIAAPAGFGKTTMIAEWLSSRSDGRVLKTELIATSLSPQSSVLSTQVAWLALDDTDNHLGQFLAYLIAALETVRPKLGAEAWALLRAQAAHPPTHAILTSLVNALAAVADQIVLVLDDYHTITLQAIHAAITFLLDCMPTHMQIVITTRADPPLPLARLRARGQLAELRAADLRFTDGEAAYLFNHIHRIALAPDAVAALEARTEGWATGLQLAALSLRQQAVADMPTFLADFTGSHTYVFDYLAEEVFQRQPDHVRTFLVQTAILDRLCGPLCAAVTGQNDAQTLLEDLDQANLFLIRLDSNRRWYRYHHLFRDFLLEQLDRAIGPADRAGFYRRASTWFEQQGLMDEAIGSALSARGLGRCSALHDPADGQPALLRVLPRLATLAGGAAGCGAGRRARSRPAAGLDSDFYRTCGGCRSPAVPGRDGLALSWKSGESWRTARPTRHRLGVERRFPARDTGGAAGTGAVACGRSRTARGSRLCAWRKRSAAWAYRVGNRLADRRFGRHAARVGRRAAPQRDLPVARDHRYAGPRLPAAGRSPARRRVVPRCHHAHGQRFVPASAVRADLPWVAMV